MNNMFNDVHIERWEELPDFPLYMDQVIGIIEKSLSFLKINEDDKIVTSTMINNYVKAKLVSAPIKKKYYKEHVAYFTVIVLLKRVYSLEEISKLLKIQFDNIEAYQAYDVFAEVLETLLKGISKDTDLHLNDERVADLFMKVMKSVVYSLYVSKSIKDNQTLLDAKKAEQQRVEEENKRLKEEAKKAKKAKKGS